MALDLEAPAGKGGSCRGLRPAELGQVESSSPGTTVEKKIQFRHLLPFIVLKIYLFICSLFHDTKLGAPLTARFT